MVARDAAVEILQDTEGRCSGLAVWIKLRSCFGRHHAGCYVERGTVILVEDGNVLMRV